ncbi:hypothetical protein H0H81_007885 [Sphagnurus paluster]|uniref:Uncharacterized protein n=1 Tax=Sphagnurus paluster TaxID=117069 RepID=A0A9P7GJ90_9AGAR|nr:hypothetical protein H0H81_007885 [Sphagnurus paluster]
MATRTGLGLATTNTMRKRPTPNSYPPPPAAAPSQAQAWQAQAVFMDDAATKLSDPVQQVRSLRAHVLGTPIPTPRSSRANPMDLVSQGLGSTETTDIQPELSA